MIWTRGECDKSDVQHANQWNLIRLIILVMLRLLSLGDFLDQTGNRFHRLSGQDCAMIALQGDDFDRLRRVLKGNRKLKSRNKNFES